MNDNQKRICKDSMMRKTQEIAVFQTYKDDVVTQVEKISSLAKKLGKSEDIKETTDISAAIQAQVAHLQAKKMQIDMMLAQNKAKAEVDARQKEQMYQEKKGKVSASW